MLVAVTRCQRFPEGKAPVKGGLYDIIEGVRVRRSDVRGGPKDERFPLR